MFRAFGIRHLDLFRISCFGFRISKMRAPCAQVTTEDSNILATPRFLVLPGFSSCNHSWVRESRFSITRTEDGFHDATDQQARDDQGTGTRCGRRVGGSGGRRGSSGPSCCVSATSGRPGLRGRACRDRGGLDGRSRRPFDAVGRTLRPAGRYGGPGDGRPTDGPREERPRGRDSRRARRTHGGLRVDRLEVHRPA
jgi:hypothetical protein